MESDQCPWNDFTDTLGGGKSLLVWGQVEVDGHPERYQWVFEVFLRSGILNSEMHNTDADTDDL